MPPPKTEGRVLFTDDLHYARTAQNIVGPVWCAKHHFSGPWPCDCPPGPQVQALNSIADEILFGGARGGGKSEMTLLFMIKGNPPERHTGLPVDISYLNSPLYRGLILRESLVDMEDFLDRARQMYERGGAHFKFDSPITITWPSGAKFVVSHLADDKTAGKVLGPSYHRVAWEQLEQIRKEDVYKKLFGSMRSTIPGIFPQLMANANPGSGPGQAWIVNRFIDLYGVGFVPHPQGKVYVNPETRKTRVFISSRVVDNPYLVRCPDCGVPSCGNETHALPPYVANLMEQPEHLRKAWIEGDWKALAGGYFPEFRAEKVAGEPANALHCRPLSELAVKPWWNTWMACDWGRTHPCCTLWFRENPDTHVINVYREYAINKMTANEVGAGIALRTQDDMKHLPHKQVVMALSPTSFGQVESDHSIADQISEGIQSVMGKGSSFVMWFTEGEKKLPYEEAYRSMLRRREEVQSACRILIIKANDRRIDGWERIRDFLRWKPLQDESNSAFNPQYARELMEKYGTLPYLEYMKQFEGVAQVLPRLQIASECREVKRSLGMLIFAKGDKEGTGDAEKMDGDDPAEALRYGIMAYEPRTAKMPEGEFVAGEIKKLTESTGYLSPTSLVHAAMQAKHVYDTKVSPKSKAFTPSRRGNRSNRVLGLLSGGM